MKQKVYVPSIETLSGSPFVETIRIEKGRIHNLPYHNARMNRTRRELFGAREEIDLAGYIHPGLIKNVPNAGWNIPARS